ncbi:very short patch repair endonuclease [Jatrophihabitans cynanchi]|uniref:Very short patch repair endonuclease n=1 Tax=Jatrophihabitans cynanchi TaxID=2944128 RepID=A0ABY7K2V9_9ACTN|nr:very short patch repair endonuclease [Jatrophihabitans sp. SB3-54]WAX58535.1 very short patch repair endonuclease [Jatrophihabitans sp. SB3-54]
MNRDAAITSRIMAAVKNTGTRPELALRRELFRRGLRYRVRTRVLGHPDIVFPTERIACFVDGDRWHGNGWKIRGLESFEAEFGHRNAQFWKEKITRNMRRDQDVNRGLEHDGWTIVRVWASEVERDVTAVADRVETTVRASRQRRTDTGR